MPLHETISTRNRGSLTKREGANQTLVKHLFIRSLLLLLWGKRLINEQNRQRTNTFNNTYAGLVVSQPREWKIVTGRQYLVVWMCILITQTTTDTMVFKLIIKVQYCGGWGMSSPSISMNLVCVSVVNCRLSNPPPLRRSAYFRERDRRS